MAVWLSLSLSQGTPNATARTTTVTAIVKVHYSGGSFNGNSPSGTLTVDGQPVGFNCNFNYAGIGQGAASTGTGSVTACSRTFTVSYGSSSTRTISASASFESGTASGTVTASDSITLTSIGTSSGGGPGSGGDDDDNTEEWNPDNPGSGSGGGSNPAAGNVTVVGQAKIPPVGTSEPYYQTESWTSIGCGAGISSACILKIITPSFSGVSEYLTVSLAPYYDWWEADDLLMCYALCDSDENHHLYYDAQSVVSDPHQIVCGTLSRYEILEPFTILTDKLVGNKDYYLIFWLPSDGGHFEATGLDVATMHSINLKYDGTSGGDDSEYPYNFVLNYTIGEHCKVESYFYSILDSTETQSCVRKYRSGSPLDFTFVFIADEGYKLSGCSVDGVSCDDTGTGTLTATNGDYFIVASAIPDDGDPGGEDPGGEDPVIPTVTRGVFHIDNGTELVAYECFIDNGTGWDPIGGGSNQAAIQRATGVITTDDSGFAQIECGFEPDLVVLGQGEKIEGVTEQCAVDFTLIDTQYAETFFCIAQEYIVVSLILAKDNTGFHLNVGYYDPEFVGYPTTLSYSAVKYT